MADSTAQPGASRSRQTGVGVAFAVSSGVVFSVSTVCAQRALNAGASVALVAGARLTIGCALLWLLNAVIGTQAIPAPTRLRLMAVGVFTALQVFLLYQSVARISAPLAVLLLYSYPALVAVLSAIFLREALTPLKAAAVAISLAGATAITGLPSGRVTLAGCLFGLGSGLSLACYIVLVSHAARGIAPLTAVAWLQLGASVAFVPLALILAGPGLHAGGSVWIVAVGLAAGTAAALFLAGIKRLRPTAASVASTIEPISTAALSVALLGITLTIGQLIGGMLILGALVLISVEGARHPGTVLTTR